MKMRLALVAFALSALFTGLAVAGGKMPGDSKNYDAWVLLDYSPEALAHTAPWGHSLGAPLADTRATIMVLGW